MYRIGNSDDGKGLYRHAMEVAERSGAFLARALAALFYAREAILAKTSYAREALEDARKAAKRVTSPGVEFYLRKLDALLLRPDDASRILSPAHARDYQNPKGARHSHEGLRTIQTSTGPVLIIPDRYWAKP
jgi:hypothetical protein